MLIQASISPWVRGNQQEESSTRFQKVVDIPQRGFILLNMFQDVKADDRINRIGPVAFTLCPGDIEALNHKFFILSEGILQKGEVLRLHVGRDDEVSIQKKLGDVTDPRADFQNSSAQEGPEC